MSALPLQEGALLCLVKSQDPGFRVRQLSSGSSFQSEPMRLWEAQWQLREHDGLMIAWGYFLLASYNNFCPQKAFNCFYYITISEVKGLILSSLSLQEAISRTVQKEKPLKSLICLSFLIFLHFLSLLPHTFKKTQ